MAQINVLDAVLMSSGARISARHIFRGAVANGNYIYQLSTLSIIGSQMTASVGFVDSRLWALSENRIWWAFYLKVLSSAGSVIVRGSSTISNKVWL